jgi:hypothetical protein
MIGPDWERCQIGIPSNFAHQQRNPKTMLGSSSGFEYHLPGSGTKAPFDFANNDHINGYLTV